MAFQAAARRAAVAADDKKAREIRLFDVRRLSAVADYFLIVTVDSGPQMEAVEDGIARRLQPTLSPWRRDDRSLQWRVMDYGGLVIHLMTPAARNFYALERLWEGARRLAWSRPASGAVRGAGRKGAV